MPVPVALRLVVWHAFKLNHASVGASLSVCVPVCGPVGSLNFASASSECVDHNFKFKLYYYVYYVLVLCRRVLRVQLEAWVCQC